VGLDKDFFGGKLANNCTSSVLAIFNPLQVVSPPKLASIENH